jgi:hypothetical protein
MLATSFRRAVAIGDNDVAVFVAGGELVVGVDLVALLWAVEIAFGGIDAGLGEGGSQSFHGDAVGRKGDRVGLDANRGFLSAADADEADTGELRNFGREPGVNEVFDLRQRDRTRGDAESKNRSVGRVGLVVDGRSREIGGQETLGCVDGRLDFFFSDVDVEG